MKNELNDISIEAHERYGNTATYREHEQKTKNYSKEKWVEASDGLMAIFAEFAACKQNGAEDDSMKCSSPTCPRAYAEVNCWR